MKNPIKKMPFMSAIFISGMFIFFSNMFAQAQDSRALLNRTWQSHEIYSQPSVEQKNRSQATKPPQNSRPPQGSRYFGNNVVQNNRDPQATNAPQNSRPPQGNKPPQGSRYFGNNVIQNNKDPQATNAPQNSRPPQGNKPPQGSRYFGNNVIQNNRDPQATNAPQDSRPPQGSRYFGNNVIQNNRGSQATNAPQDSRPPQATNVPQGNSAVKRPKRVISAPSVQYVEKSANAKKILFVGDFVANAASDGLNELYADNGNYIVVNRTQGSSGLVRDGFYNWHDNLTKIVAQKNPDVVVFIIGANDRQSFTIGNQNIDFGHEGWNKIYQQRIDTIIKDLQATQKPWLWVGVPSFGKLQLHQSTGLFNSYFKSAVGRINGQEHRGQFIDLWDGFVDDTGSFALSGYDMNGNTARLRTNDGINFTKAGRQKLAFYVKAPLEGIVGASLSKDPNDKEDETVPVEGSELSSSIQTITFQKKIKSIPPVNLADLLNKNKALVGGDAGTHITMPIDKNIVHDEQQGRADYFVQP